MSFAGGGSNLGRRCDDDDCDCSAPTWLQTAAISVIVIAAQTLGSLAFSHFRKRKENRPPKRRNTPRGSK